jgi:quinol monooxygenase YgiN/quercetin dioxygenase-like cupin family protein
MRSPKTALLTLAVLALSAIAARAQDPLPLYPDNYKVLFENDRVRVLDFQLRKGATEKPHHHPAHVAYILAPMKIRFTLPDGTTRLREARAGDVLFSEEVTHASENIGNTDAHGILVELKGAAAGKAVAEAPRGFLEAITYINGIPGREKDLEAHLLSLTGPTRAEPGNLGYDLYRSESEGNRFVRLERWKDQAALETHKAMPYMRASFEKRQREGWTTEITLWRKAGD